MTTIEGYPLSPEQRRLFRIGAAHRLVAQVALRLRGAPSPKVIGQAIEDVVSMRPILTTAFVTVPASRIPVMVLGRDPVALGALRVVRTTGPDSSEIDRVLDADSEAFDLTRHCNVRASLIEGAEHSVLAVTVPSVCADAESLSWFAEDLATVLDGQVPHAEQVPYEQYAAWRNELAPRALAEEARVRFEPKLFGGATPTALARRLSDELGVTSGAVWTAAFRSVFASWYGWRLEGRIVGHRSEPELVRAIGCFANILPLPRMTSGERSFAEHVAECSRLLAANLPTVGVSPLTGRASAHLFEVSGRWPTIQRSRVEIEVLRRRAWVDAFSMAICIDGERPEIWYDAHSRTREEIERIVSAATGVMSMAACSASSIVVPASSSLASMTVHRAFQEQARRTPNQVAVAALGRRVSYAELDASSSVAAAWLRNQGVVRGSLVALSVPSSPELVSWVLAVLKAGAAFMPIDATLPAARRAQLIAAARPAVHVDQSVSLQDFGGECPPDFAVEDDLAYVIYTSGSTRGPKGVMVSHRSIHAYVTWASRAFDLSASDAVPLHTSIGADLTLTSLLAPLYVGATIEILSPGDTGELAIAAALRAGRRYGLVKMTPTHLKAVLTSVDGAPIGSVRTLALGGEDVSVDDVAEWQARFGGGVVNEYGPTEATVGCTAELIDTRDQGPVSIGAAIGGASIHVLDRGLNAVRSGELGELYVAGPGLARGYLDDAAATAERFLPNPFGNPGARLYRTGDLAIVSSAGKISLRGRIDAQVKIRGHRVDPSEVEQVLAKHPAVRQAAISVRHTVDGPRLVAHVVPEPAQRPRALHRLPNGLVVSQVSRTETELLYREIFEGQSYLRHGVSLCDGDCVFDVGANIGMFTLFTLVHAPGAQVFAFEPSEALCRLLRANLSRHGLTAHVHQTALSAQPGEAVFTYYPGMSTMSGVLADPEEDQRVSREVTRSRGGEYAAAADALVRDRFAGETQTVAVTTVSRMLREERLERIDLLKIDAEKSEAHILDGIEESDWRRIRQIVVEVHDFQGRAALMAADLERRGYAVALEVDPAYRATSLRQLYAVRHPCRSSAALCGSVPVARTLSRELRDHLAALLPRSHVPAEIVLSTGLPTTTSGKIDRQALAAAALSETLGAPRVQPRNELEARICRLFAEVLRRESIGVHDDFFELGGDSLLSLQLVARASRCGIPLAPRTLFRASTPAAIANSLPSISSSMEQASSPGEAPLTSMQERILYGGGALNHHVQCVAFRLDPTLKTDSLRAALKAVLQTHDALRLKFEKSAAGVWRAETSADTLFDLEIVGAASVDAESGVVQRLRERIDPTMGRMFAVTVVKDEGVPATLVIAAHHLAMDAISWRILLDDLVAAYAGSLGRHADGGFRAVALAAGRERTQPDTLDINQTLPTVVDTGSHAATAVTRGLAWQHDELRALATLAGVTIEDALLAAWLLAVSQWSGRTRLAIELESHGRSALPDDRAARTVGPFAVHVQAEVDLSHPTTVANFLEWIARSRDTWRLAPPIARGTAELAFNYLGEVYSYRPQPPLAGRVPLQSPTALLDQQQIAVNFSFCDGRLEAEVLHLESRIPPKVIDSILDRFDLALRNLHSECQSRQGAENECCPLAPAQEGMLFHSLRAPATGHYVAAVSFQLVGALDEPTLERAWWRVAAAHDCLRTVIQWKADALGQSWPQAIPSLKRLDWRSHAESTQDSELADLIELERRRDFEPGAPMFRPFVIRLGECRHVVVMIFHHAILDGWSFAIVLGDLLDAYCAERESEIWQGRRRRHYAEYVQWVRSNRAASESDERFWRTMLGEHTPARGYPEVGIVAVTGGASARHLKALEPREVEGGVVMPSVLLFGAWALALYRSRGERRPVFGVTLSGRPSELADSHDMVGMFSNTLPLCVSVEPTAAVGPWLLEVRERFLSVAARETTALADVQRCLGVHGALFDTVVVVQNYPAFASGALEALDLRVADVRFIEPSHYPLTLTASLRPRAELRVAYDDVAFAASTACSLLSDAELVLMHLSEASEATPLQQILDRVGAETTDSVNHIRPTLGAAIPVRRSILEGSA